jgi:hypothetical protein
VRKRWTIFRTWSGWEFLILWNARNWALPASFGGGVWADEEIGDYGQVFSCEYFGTVIVGIFCFWFYFTWPKEWRESLKEFMSEVQS